MTWAPVSPEERKIREQNKCLRSIYTEDGKDYGPDVTDVHELSRRLQEARMMTDRRIAHVFREIEKSSLVDVCFLMDCTGSMSAYITQVREVIEKIVSRCTTTGQVKGMRWALVGYRDICDGFREFEVLDFTGEVSAFRAFCAKVTPHGGSGNAADVFGGLVKTLALSWDRERLTKVVFHMADEPCHGKEFHAGKTYDPFPDGDPQGRTAKELFKQLWDLGIQYHFGKIRDITDLMIVKFQEVYGEPIVTFDIKDPKLLEAAVISSVSTSVERTVGATVSGTMSRGLRKYDIQVTEPDWKLLPTQIGSYLSYKFPDSVGQLLDPTAVLERVLTRKIKIKVAPHPFSHGAERIAYYGRDLTHATDPGSEGAHIILKEYKHVGKGVNAAPHYETSCQIQTIASYFAHEFHKKHGQAVRLKFLKVKTLSLPLVNSKVRYMSCEKELEQTTKFVRFTNNLGYKITTEKMVEAKLTQANVDLVMAFSHWTNQATGGKMMVTDLEGCSLLPKAGSTKETLLLTDPAILDTDTTRYQPLNLGKRGMEAFFKSHVCNPICKKLSLTYGGI